MADVASSFKSWSATVGSNAPTSSTTIGSGLAPNFQQIQATLRTELGTRSAALTAATTTDLSTKDEGTVLVSNSVGTVAITSFGTVSAGIKKLITFSVTGGTLSITHNGTSLILPAGANITVADGDSLYAESLGSGNWKVHAYYKKDGSPVSGGAPFVDSTPLLKGSADATKLVAFEVDTNTPTGTTVTVTTPAASGTMITDTNAAVSADINARTATNKYATPSSLQGLIVSSTSQATTSGTAITFTGIPTWAKRVTLMLNGVSTNGTNLILAQLGNGSAVTSGYLDYVVNIQGGGSTTTKTTTGFAGDGGGAAFLHYGTFVFTFQTGNTWVCSKSLGGDNTGIARASTGGGIIALAGALDRVILTSVGSTDTFDAGSANIFWE